MAPLQGPAVTDHSPQRRLLDIAVDGFAGRGGTERQIVAIAIGMAARGWQPRIIVRYMIDLRGEHAAELREAGVELVVNPRHQEHRPLKSRALAVAGRVGVDVGARSERDAYLWLSQQLRSGSVVHEIPYFGRIPPTGRAVYDRHPVPLVQTILGTPADPVHPVADWAAVTSDGDPRLTDPHHPITWIPCMTAARPGAGYRAPGPEEIALLFVGRLVHSKGLDLLLRALQDMLPRFRLTVVGDGPERAALKDLADGRTRFAGSLSSPEVREALSAAHLLVVPSRKDGVQLADGMPTVISEAMSQGCPVLASAVGGVPRVFARRDPSPGWLVEPDSVSSLRNALESLTAQDLARASVGATRAYSELLSPETTLAAYEARYRTVLERSA